MVEIDSSIKIPIDKAQASVHYGFEGVKMYGVTINDGTCHFKSKHIGK